MAKKIMSTLSDTGLFLQEWFANPKRTGSVVPSSKRLASAMARWLPKDPTRYVLELGPGTGVVTDALIARACAKTSSSSSSTMPKWRVCFGSVSVAR